MASWNCSNLRHRRNADFGKTFELWHCLLLFELSGFAIRLFRLLNYEFILHRLSIRRSSTDPRARAHARERVGRQVVACRFIEQHIRRRGKILIPRVYTATTRTRGSASNANVASPRSSFIPRRFFAALEDIDAIVNRFRQAITAVTLVRLVIKHSARQIAKRNPFAFLRRSIGGLQIITGTSWPDSSRTLFSLLRRSLPNRET